MNNSYYAQANDLEAIVFAVDYRVAPENKFPVLVRDCYTTFKWVIANAHKFGGDTSKIILSCTSAGGKKFIYILFAIIYLFINLVFRFKYYYFNASICLNFIKYLNQLTFSYLII